MPDSIKDDLELSVALFLQAIEPARKVPIRRNEPAEMHKGPHDSDVDLMARSLFRTLDNHRDAVLGEGVGRRRPETATSGGA